MEKEELKETQLNKKTLGKDIVMKEIISFAKEKGIIWGPSPEIYGGLAGFYTYAPLGKLLKNNVENAVRNHFQKNNFWEVELPTVMPRIVWEASGHLNGFTDPVIKAEDGNNYRVDTLIEEFFRKKGIEFNLAEKSNEELLEIIKENNIKAPNGASLIPEIKEHSLMMRTTIGLDQEAYNRPETATTTYLPFLRYFDFFRKKVPFGVFQIGKAYRNEISPRQFILRLREFTQAEAQLFIFSDQKNNFEKYEEIKDIVIPFWDYKLQEKEEEPKNKSVEEALKEGLLKNKAYAFAIASTFNLFKSLGITHIRLRQHAPNERAFYADDAWDIEVKLNSFGWTEICGIHDRTDYDLKQHSKFSKKLLAVSDETHKKEIPHIIEIAFGIDRLLFVLIDNLYDPKNKDEGKNILKLPYNIAPIKAAVFPLVKKEGMPLIAKRLYDKLSSELVVIYDQNGSIGKRYLRAAEQGVPFCLTIDGRTLEDNTITIRDRDTEEQKRILLDDSLKIIRALLNKEITFNEL